MSSIRVCLITAAALAAVGVAQAQTAPATKADDSSLTWKGITLYGVVDLGLQNDTHSAPFSDVFYRGGGAVVQKNDYDSPTALVPSGLSQSRLGISGNEPIAGDWAGVFRLESIFNPQSGTLGDAMRSLTLNNGKAVDAQTASGDGSYAGQLFAGAAYVGFASPTYGSFTFGRHATLLTDGVTKYDPMGGAPQFSLVGFSGVTAGGGSSEDTRLDQSVKYYGKYDWLHLGALYQFGTSSGSTNTGYQLQIGGEYGGFSLDGYYFKKYDAVASAALSAAQVADLQTAASCTAAAPATAYCWPIGSSVSATVSDNQTYAVMLAYTWESIRVSGGYEHIAFDNPSNALTAGTPGLGGYILAFVNNAAYDNQKTLEVWWAGLKWTMTPDLDVTLAYYAYSQNSYATGADAGCSTTVSAGCSGTEGVASILFDYRLTKRFDLYAGSMWSGVQDGLANGFLNKDNIATTVGVRFKF